MESQKTTQLPPTNSPPLPPPKPRLPLLLIGLVLSLVLLGASYLIFGTKKPESLTPPVSQTPPTAVPIVDPTVNWKTYISQVFSIKYPSYWHLSENKWENQKYVVLSDNPDASANTFTIDIYENSQMDQTTDYILHYYVNSTAGLADRYPKEISKTRVNIAEVEADKYIYKLDEQQEFPYNESTVIIFQYGQDSYVFKVSGKDQRILDQILSTFQFINEDTIEDVLTKTVGITLNSPPPIDYAPIPQGTRLLDLKVEGNDIVINLSKEILANGTGVELENSLHLISVQIGNLDIDELKNKGFKFLIEGEPLENYRN